MCETLTKQATRALGRSRPAATAGRDVSSPTPKRRSSGSKGRLRRRQDQRRPVGATRRSPPWGRSSLLMRRSTSTAAGARRSRRACAGFDAEAASSRRSWRRIRKIITRRVKAGRKGSLEECARRPGVSLFVGFELGEGPPRQLRRLRHRQGRSVALAGAGTAEGPRTGCGCRRRNLAEPGSPAEADLVTDDGVGFPAGFQRAALRLSDNLCSLFAGSGSRGAPAASRCRRASRCEWNEPAGRGDAELLRQHRRRARRPSSRRTRAARRGSRAARRRPRRRRARRGRRRRRSARRCGRRAHATRLAIALRESVDRRLLAEHRVEVGGGERRRRERAEPLAQRERAPEGLLHGDLLVQCEADRGAPSGRRRSARWPPRSRSSRDGRARLDPRRFRTRPPLTLSRGRDLRGSADAPAAPAPARAALRRARALRARARRCCCSGGSGSARGTCSTRACRGGSGSASAPGGSSSAFAVLLLWIPLRAATRLRHASPTFSSSARVIDLVLAVVPTPHGWRCASRCSIGGVRPQRGRDGRLPRRRLGPGPARRADDRARRARPLGPRRAHRESS